MDRIDPQHGSDVAAGRINQQRQVGSAPPTPTYPPPAGRGSGYYPTGRGAGWAGQYVPDRYAPYHQPRAYPHKPVHRNRTLVVNSSVGAPASQQSSPATPAVTPSSSQWVSKRDRHMQLINTAVYDQKTQQRQLEIEATEQERQRLRDAKEKAKVIKAFQAHSTGSTPYGAASSASTAAVHDTQINNLRFRVAADGSKLIRMFGEYTSVDSFTHFLTCTDDSNTDPGATPKSAKVAGVTFHRSKNGNLYRAGLVKKSLRYWKKSQELWEEQLLIDWSSELCSMFTSTGTEYSNRYQAGPCATDLNETAHLTMSVGMCANGNRCHYTHDPNKTAICKDFLRTGRCVAGEACNLSHESTPHRVPACTHFLRGNCTNPDCRYAHVAVNPSAPVCRAFGTIGYCEKGADCTERHMFECPDYANTGVCRNKKCRLPHVDTAGNLRKAKLAEAKTEEGNTSDLSSDEESYDGIDYDDVDSDNFSDNEVMGGTEERDHELAQQQDYVGFS
ncbi:hypothetical protein D6D10_02617 [Aureobasidium pullulans]|uniref:C3H1-type domain-containing protein n=1 Tax=Aureobasidium pullulans TaxID=5580 RepID=A0A4S9F2E0_AURPU|nr:hypothetical protein D6D10_02617 [Aureobasidium pullulans]